MTLKSLLRLGVPILILGACNHYIKPINVSPTVEIIIVQNRADALIQRSGENSGAKTDDKIPCEVSCSEVNVAEQSQLTMDTLSVEPIENISESGPFIAPVVPIIEEPRQVSLPPPTPSSMRLPVCHLEKCDESDGTDCASKVLSLVQNSGDDTWSLFSNIPLQLQAFADRGYYVESSTFSSVEQVGLIWRKSGCVRDLLADVSDATATRERRCELHMPKWLKMANDEPINRLEFDTDFRRVCMRVTD